MTAQIASNMNFPAPIAVLGFLAAAGGIFFMLACAVITAFMGKPMHKTKLGRLLLAFTAAGAVAYLALLIGFSLSSHPHTLALGQEKYFCEIDCHLAYSIVDVKSQPEATTTHYLITLRTRFDETTTSPQRPKDAPLTPSPRVISLVDAMGNEYAPASTQGTALLTPLKPADNYTTQLEFNVPQETKNLKLLIRTKPAWHDHMVIGDENSYLHQKTYFAIASNDLNL